MKWRECPYEVRLKVLHQLVHEARISEADLSLIMAVLGYDISQLLIYNIDARPGAVGIYGNRSNTADPVTRLQAARRVVVADTTSELIQAIAKKLLESKFPRRCDYPDEFWADLEMSFQWCRENCPPELQDKFPHRPWPEWLPSELQRKPNGGFPALIARIAQALFLEPKHVGAA